MQIGLFRKEYDRFFGSCSETAELTCEQAWRGFKDFLELRPDGEFCEEIKFCVDLIDKHSQIHDGHTGTLLQIYFGRLIDARKGQPWATIEIDFYFNVSIAGPLPHWAGESNVINKEFCLCLDHDADHLRWQMAEFIQYVDQLSALWQTVHESSPESADHHFFVY